MGNIFTVILSVLVGILAGVSLLLGINNTVMNANLPLVYQVKEMNEKIDSMEKKMDQVLVTITQQASDLAVLKAQPMPAAQPQPSAAAQQMPPSEDFNKVYDIPVGNSVIIGKKDAPVTIVMFNDLQCPFCERFYPGVRDTLANYPDKVRLIIKHFPLPFHPNARPAAKIALAASEQGKFKEMMEALMTGGADVSEAKVKEYAKTTGVNYTKLMNDVKNNDAKYEAQLAEDAKLVESSDVRGTPSFYINGKKAQVRDAAGYKEIIDKL